MFGLPLSLVILILAGATTASAPLLIKGYRRFVAFMKAKTGVELPDNPEIEAKIIDVIKALEPVLLHAISSKKLDPEEARQAVESAVGELSPEGVKHVAPALADMHPKFNAPGLR